MVEALSSEYYVHAFTDDSFVETFLHGSSRIQLVFPDSSIHQCKVGVEKLPSNFTCGLRTIIEALEMYLYLLDSNKSKGLK